MAHYPYLIIGGGMTADAAVRGIRELDPGRAIDLIGQPGPFLAADLAGRLPA